MATIDKLMAEGHNRNLIRKALKGVAFIARKDKDLPEALVTADGIIDLKAEGWLCVGLVTQDGYDFGEETEKEDTTSHGYMAPTRSDISGVVRSVTATLQESFNRDMQEFLNGADYSGVTMDAHGNVAYKRPDTPLFDEWRMLVIAVDGPADEQWVMGKGFGAVKITTKDAQTWATEGALTNSVTLDVFTDPDVGVPVVDYVGGSGPLKHAEALGFTAPTGG